MTFNIHCLFHSDSFGGFAIIDINTIMNIIYGIYVFSNFFKVCLLIGFFDDKNDGIVKSCHSSLALKVQPFVVGSTE